VLEGFNVDKGVGHISVALYWAALGSAPERYKIFLHLKGPDGQIHAQADFFPQLPTTAWIKGDRLLDQADLAIPPGLLPGPYTLIAGMYEPDSGERVPVQTESSLSDHVILEVIELP
jgi:hypothetical protein